MRPKGIGVVVILVVVAILGIVAAILLPMLSKARECACSPPTCINNLRQLGMILEHYAGENDKQYPPINDFKNNFIFNETPAFPEYPPDMSFLHCPEPIDFTRNKHAKIHAYYDELKASKGWGSPNCIMDTSYCYLGWVITNDEEAEAFFEAYDNLSPEDYDKDIVVPEGKGNGGGNIIHRLEKGAERFLNDPEKDASTIPVMWDKPSGDIVNLSHVPAGGFVLYLDGTVEFIRYYPGKFPISEKFGRMLDELKRDPIPGCED